MRSGYIPSLSSRSVLKVMWVGSILFFRSGGENVSIHLILLSFNRTSIFRQTRHTGYARCIFEQGIRVVFGMIWSDYLLGMKPNILLEMGNQWIDLQKGDVEQEAKMD